MTIYGSTSDINRVVHIIGAPITVNSKTDWAYHGMGVVLGLIIGWVVIRIGNIPITLGAGGGALLSGLFFGWLRARKQTFGNMPAAASQFMKDFGLAGFVSVVGLQSFSVAMCFAMTMPLFLLVHCPDLVVQIRLLVRFWIKQVTLFLPHHLLLHMH